VLVLRAVVDEQQHPDRPEAVHQAVQQRLGLAVDPVEVFDDKQQRLHLALPEQKSLDGLEGALAPLGRVEGPPSGILRGDVQEGEDWRK